MKPIELTLCDGNPVTICTAAIAYFQPADEHTLIALTSGSTVTVRESYDQVAEVFNPERQDGC